MVYISGGNIGSQAPWSTQTFYNYFWGAVFLVINFFQTLVGLDERPTRITPSGFRGGFGGGSGGGRGGGNGPGGPRGLGNVKSITDYSSPGGGCSGGSCSGGGCFS